jgi:nicotinamide-nucleotide amidase
MTPSDLAAVAERVGSRLHETDATLAVAESATGGLVASLLTDVPGASDYLDRSVVTYSNDAKQDLLAVSREALDAEGAVSAPVAREMAAGVRDTAGTTWGLSTSGIAGPTGGTEAKPVGTILVGVAFAGPWGSESSTVDASRFEFDGDRRTNKEQFARQALETLLESIESRS